MADHLQYTGTAGIPFVNRPTGGGNFTSMRFANMKIDGGGLASAIFELGSLGQSYFENMSVGHVAGGSDHVIEFGHFGGDVFQVFRQQYQRRRSTLMWARRIAATSRPMWPAERSLPTPSTTGEPVMPLTPAPGTDRGVTTVTRAGRRPRPCTVMPDPPTAPSRKRGKRDHPRDEHGSGCSGTIECPGIPDAQRQLRGHLP